MYSYLTFKATRSLVLVESGLTLQVAIIKASTLYDSCKIMHNNNLLPSGVTVIVIEDALAAKHVLTNTMPNTIDYQCGSY